MEALKKEIIKLHSLNYLFNNKYENIENDVSYIKQFDITLGQQIKRLKEYEEYQYLKSYLLPNIRLPLVDIKLSQKIEKDLIALDRFCYKEGESEKLHFKDISRCLKQDRFKDNYFYHDVFFYCDKEKIDKNNAIKLALLSQNKRVFDLIANKGSEFKERINQDFSHFEEIKIEIKELLKYGIPSDSFFVAMIWGSKDKNEFNQIRHEIRDIKEIMKTPNENINIKNKWVMAYLAQHKHSDWLLEEHYFNNQLLLNLFDVKKEFETSVKEKFNAFQSRVFNQHWLEKNEITGEKIELEKMSEDLMFLSEIKQANVDPRLFQIKIPKEQNKSIKKFIKSLNEYKVNDKKLKITKKKTYSY